MPELDRRGMRVLILGGTGFIGPHFVRAALARGHRVAVFNRASANGGLPDEVERLVGDRTSDLSAISGREWDAVIDLAAFVPLWVRRLGEALGDRVGHYTFVSTHYAYRPPPPGEPAIEGMPVREFEGDIDPYSLESLVDPTQYGALKVLCEREAEARFPGRTFVMRPGYIVGRGDPQPFLPYLPLRMARGGDVLVAGTPEEDAQFVEARDLAEFSIRMAETGGVGVFNMAGPAERTTLGEVLDAAAVVAGASPNLTWVSSSWLAARDDGTFRFPLFWSSDGISAWVTPTDNRKAIAAGATFRPVAETLAESYAGAKETAPERDDALTVRGRDASGRPFADTIPWSAYLDRERETLAAWRAESA